MKLNDPKKAVGHKIRWCKWSERQYLLVENVLVSSRQIEGKFHDKNGIFQRSFSMMSGITTGKIMTDHWYMINYNSFKLDDELFEI
jgi:hypothetical protein